MTALLRHRRKIADGLRLAAFVLDQLQPLTKKLADPKVIEMKIIKAAKGRPKKKGSRR